MMRSVNIPFQGFYETWHDDSLDRALEQCFTDSSGDPLGGKFNDAWELVDWKAVHTAYGKWFALALCERLGLKGAEFEEMVSPREYNVTTDRLFVLLPESECERMLAETPGAVLAEVARKNHTSRSGFISFYSNCTGDWGDFAGWDHNHLGTLFEAYLLHKEGPDFDEWEELCQDLNCNGALDNWIFESCKPELKRLDKLAAYLREREERRYHHRPQI